MRLTLATNKTETMQMFKQFTIDCKGCINEQQQRTLSPYKIYQENLKLGKEITEEQKREISDTLFQKGKMVEVFKQQYPTVKKDTSSIVKPTKMRVQHQASPSSNTNTLYKMRLEYILN